MRRKLNEAELQASLIELPEWHLGGGSIVRTMETKDFPAVIDLVGRIAEIAEAADHHPDMDIRYTKLRIALSTHDAGGVTVKDVEMAKKINALV